MVIRRARRSSSIVGTWEQFSKCFIHGRAFAAWRQPERAPDGAGEPGSEDWIEAASGTHLAASRTLT